MQLPTSGRKPQPPRASTAVIYETRITEHGLCGCRRPRRPSRLLSEERLLTPHRQSGASRPKQPRRAFLSALASTAAALPLLHCSGPTKAPPSELDALRQRRKQAAHRRRRIIYNNDGDDALHFRQEGADISQVGFAQAPQSETVTPEAFLDIRIAPIPGTHIDSLFYCDTQSFGAFLHPSDVAEVFTNLVDRGDGGASRNITRELIAQGTSPLQLAIEFCRRNGIEIFSSVRMNDIHDGVGAVYSDAFLAQFKIDHPEYLFGAKGDKLAHGYWSGVDYAQAAVRERAFLVIEDICRRYDIDGLELDFWRHPPFFKSYAVSGKPASTEERGQMTGLLRRIRTMTEQAGLDRGRPLLVAVRVPDSVGACLSLGFDIELWLKESLFDILIGGNGVQLTPWEETVALGHAHDVPVYPCIRPAIPSRRGVGSSAESYRALAMNIWRAGADGIYTFNMFKTRDRMFRELGDPETLARLDKVYRLDAVGYSMVKQHFNADPYLRLPILSPRNPSPLQAGRTTAIPLVVGDDLQGSASRGNPPDVKLRLQVEKLANPRGLTVTINGDTLGRGSLAQGWLEYDVPPSSLKMGENRIEATPRGGLAEAPVLTDLELRIRYATEG